MAGEELLVAINSKARCTRVESTPEILQAAFCDLQYRTATFINLTPEVMEWARTSACSEDQVAECGTFACLDDGMYSAYCE